MVHNHPGAEMWKNLQGTVHTSFLIQAPQDSVRVGTEQRLVHLNGIFSGLKIWRFSITRVNTTVAVR